VVPGPEPDKSFLASKAGTLADRAEVDSARLDITRTNGRMRTTSRSPTRVLVDTRITCRALGVSGSGCSLSALRVTGCRSVPSVPRRAASRRSGTAAKWASPSSAA
jgi:hypothetical protein